MDKISFQWIGGATFILTFDNLKIAIDPVLCSKGTIQDYFWFKSERLEEPVYQKEDFNNVDLWLITHNHEDHLDEKGLQMMSEDSMVISNANSVKKLNLKTFIKHRILDWGKTDDFYINGYKIEIIAIPAIHGVNPLSALFAGKVNGYFLKITKDEKTYNIYMTGDTVYKKRIVDILKDKAIDLLIPNMGAAKQGSWIMTLTLNAKMLKKMITQLQPKMVIPVHYGTFEHYREPLAKILELKDKCIRIIPLGSKIALPSV